MPTEEQDKQDKLPDEKVPVIYVWGWICAKPASLYTIIEYCRKYWTLACVIMSIMTMPLEEQREEGAKNVMQWAAAGGAEIAIDLVMKPANEGGISAVAQRTIEAGEVLRPMSSHDFLSTPCWCWQIILKLNPENSICGLLTFETFGPMSK